MAECITSFVTAANLPTHLEAVGVQPDDLSQLAEDAAKQWTGTFNPRKVGAEELLHIYQQAYHAPSTTSDQFQ